jgi:hypothetical protein
MLTFMSVEPFQITWCILGRRKISINCFGMETERMRPLGKPRRRWEDIIKLDVKKIDWDDLDLIHLTNDRDK